MTSTPHDRRFTVHDVDASMWASACIPILPVQNVAIAVVRYEQLGFAATTYHGSEEDGPVYAFLTTLNGLEMHLTRVPDLDPATNTSAAYLRVKDVDAVFEDWQAVNPVGELIRPEDKPWGMREMAYIDSDGNLLRIGQRVNGGAAD
jgi:hypothetical protein